MNTLNEAFEIMLKRGRLNRYADHLLFSADSIPNDEFDVVYKALNDAGFEVHAFGRTKCVTIYFK
jgi:hypothetical protein